MCFDFERLCVCVKFFVGFSDIIVFYLYLCYVVGISLFYGFVLKSMKFYYVEIDFLFEYLCVVLFGECGEFELSGLKFVCEGCVIGILIGGNLSFV